MRDRFQCRIEMGRKNGVNYYVGEYLFFPFEKIEYFPQPADHQVCQVLTGD